MPICPECEQEIDHLRKFVTGEIEYRYDVNGTISLVRCIPEYENNGVFECPKCEAKLFSHEHNAIIFLFKE